MYQPWREEEYKQRQKQLDEELQTAGSYCTSANSSPPTGKQRVSEALLCDWKLFGVKITICRRQASPRVKTRLHVGCPVLIEMQIPAVLTHRVKPSQARSANVHGKRLQESHGAEILLYACFCSLYD